MKTASFLIIWVVVFVTLGLVFSSLFEIRDTRSDIVYSVCNQSRVSPDISEQECGRLQDRWKREFLCKANNTDPNTFCWVEVK